MLFCQLCRPPECLVVSCFQLCKACHAVHAAYAKSLNHSQWYDSIGLQAKTACSLLSKNLSRVHNPDAQ